MTSLDDQIRVCRTYIEREGDQLLDGFVFQDAAVSGVSEAGRDGLAALKAAICKRPSPVDYLAVADLSRLNRDLADFATLLKELRYHDIELVSVSDGMRSSDPGAQVGLVFKSLMNQIYIDDLAKKTLEGQVGQAQRGFATGGRTFGFGTKATPKLAGEKDRKRNSVVSIIDAQAAVVRAIFRLAGEGRSLEWIVRSLNEANAPCPDPGEGRDRPKGWSYSSLRAVLRNPKYSGTWAFKQSYFVKNPQTGKRQRRMLPREDWAISERPELAIISKEEFRAVQVVLDARSERYRRTVKGRLAGTKPGSTRAAYPLTGIAQCGVCGSAMSIYGGKKSADGAKTYRGYRCPAAHRSGPTKCKNKLTLSKDKLELAVFGTLSETLLSDTAIIFFETEFRKAYADAMKDAGRGRRVAELEVEIDQQEDRLNRLIDAIEAGESTTVRGRIQKAEKTRNELQKRLEAVLAEPSLPAPEPASRLVAEALRQFRRVLESTPLEAKDALRTLLGGELKLMPKEVPPDPKKNETRSTWFYEVSGAAFLQNLLIPLRRGDQDGLPVVAGAGFEPATFGL